VIGIRVIRQRLQHLPVQLPGLRQPPRLVMHQPLLQRLLGRR